jgi:hypothetical protein
MATASAIYPKCSKVFRCWPDNRNPKLAKVGKDIIEGEATLGCEDALAGMTA